MPTGPTIVTTPPSGLTVASNFSLTGRVTDPVGGLSLHAAIDGQPPVAMPLDPLGFFDLATALPLDGSADGAHTVMLQATDTAGATSTLDYHFTLDRALPATVAAENSQPGTSWDDSAITKNGAGYYRGGRYVSGPIAGYVTTPGPTLSARPGDTVGFHVNVVERAPVIFDVYRMGYYGGRGSREVASFDAVSTRQPAYQLDPTTGMVTCRWPALRVTLPSTWVTGVYVVKMTLVTHDRYDGAQSYMVFVVRPPAVSSPVVYQVSDYAWQAYNAYGGSSFYTAPPGLGLNQATALSFDRPYAPAHGDLVDLGSGSFFAHEYGCVQFLEAAGHDLSYVSGSDVDAGGPNYFLGRKVVVDGGHDEYWTTNLWQAYRTARDHGVNLLFLGSNQAYWHIAYDPHSRRVFLNKALVTAGGARADQFRNQPGFGPEGSILGSQYEGGYHQPSGGAGLPYVLTPAIAQLLTPGAALAPGGLIPGAVDGETNNTSWLARRARGAVPPGSPPQVDVLAAFSAPVPQGLVARPRPGGQLPVGRRLYWAVRAVTAYGESPAGTPAALTADARDRTALLSWQPVPGALAYGLYRGPSSRRLTLLAVVPASRPHYADAGRRAPLSLAVAPAAGGRLAPGQTYWYTVRALTRYGSPTGASNEVTLQASPDFATAALTWLAVPGAFGYQVFRGTAAQTENQLIATLGAHVTALDDNGLDGLLTSPPPSGAQAVAQMTLYRAPRSGALVFATGTAGWSELLFPGRLPDPGAKRAQQITRAILQTDLSP